MNLRDLRERAAGSLAASAGDDSQRKKLIAVSVVLVLVLVWLAISIAPSLKSHPRAVELDTPAWRLTRELNQKLQQKAEFADVVFHVVAEQPMKLGVVGGVHSEDDLKALQEYVKLLPATCEYEMKVEVISTGGDSGGGDTSGGDPGDA